MSTLIIESIANRPHLEISGEIALEYKRKGVSPDYAWIGSELGWTEWHEPKILSFFGIKIENRVKKFLKLLSKNKINIIRNEELSQKKIATIDNWAKKFNGSLNKLYKFKYKGFALGKGVASSLISHFKDNNFNPNQNLNKVRNLLISAAIIFERCDSILKKKKL